MTHRSCVLQSNTDRHSRGTHSIQKLHTETTHSATALCQNLYSTMLSILLACFEAYGDHMGSVTLCHIGLCMMACMSRPRCIMHMHGRLGASE